MKQNTKSEEIQNPVERAPIRPESVAKKLAAIRAYELPKLLKQIEQNPRIPEILWTIQAMSLRPGGLLKFTEELLAEFPERIGTPTMIEIGSRRYTAEDKLKVFSEFPKYEAPYLDISLERNKIGYGIKDIHPDEREAIEGRDRRTLHAAIHALTTDAFKDRCRREALGNLPPLLAAMCSDKATDFLGSFSDEENADRIGRVGVGKEWDDGLPQSKTTKVWYLNDLLGTLAGFIDRRALQVQKRLAMTEVARLVFDRLDYALAEKVMVRIVGNTRFGKTEAMETWCAMRPGLARFVRVPNDNSMGNLFKRIAAALGIECSYGSDQPRLKERVEFVIEQSGLFLCLDEAHYLLPQTYCATTTPHRLNWVRTEIVDGRRPVALSMTPQAWETSMSRFVQKTHYAMDQFLGRDFCPCTLPENLSEQDLIAVARIHFPQLGENALGYIANEARLSANYLQGVEAVARRARWLAARQGVKVGRKILQHAVADALGQRDTQAVDQAPMETLEAPVGLGHSRSAKPTVTTLSRGVEPASSGDAEDSVLLPGSLTTRGAGSRGPELVMAGD